MNMQPQRDVFYDPAELQKQPVVIVVGGGLAGLSAAIEATACGAQVILLEKEPKVGGNSAKATSGINGWGTRAQAEQDVYDSGKYFERDTHKSGLGGSTDPGLVRTLSVKSGDAISWL
ncbi:NADH-dependent fumarate reductase, partial [Trypanosoma cruzi]